MTLQLALLLGSTFAAFHLQEIGGRQQTAAKGKPAVKIEVLREVERGISPSQVRRLLGNLVETIEQNGEVVRMVYKTFPATRTMIYFQDKTVKAKPDPARASQLGEV